jgi:hypothetical protein
MFLNVLGESLFAGFDKLSHLKGAGYSFQDAGFDKLSQHAFHCYPSRIAKNLQKFNACIANLLIFVT